MPRTPTTKTVTFADGQGPDAVDRQSSGQHQAAS